MTVGLEITSKASTVLKLNKMKNLRLFSTTKKIYHCTNCNDIWTSDQINPLRDDVREATNYCLNCQSDSCVTIFKNTYDPIDVQKLDSNIS